jgi:hypothetical protein
LADVEYHTIAKEAASLLDSMTLVAYKGKLPDEDLVKAMMACTNPEVLNTLEMRSMFRQLAWADSVVELMPAAACVLTALSLKAHSDIWNWYRKHVTEPVLHFEKHLVSVAWTTDIKQMKTPNPWIAPLYKAARGGWEVWRKVQLKAADYFPDLGAEDYTSSRNMSTLSHIEHALFLWLDFKLRPRTTLETSRAVASFVTTASRALGNTDFLYLSSIQSHIKTLRVSLTVEGLDLSNIPWDRFSEALKYHPLANPESHEAIALARLKELRWIASGLPGPDPILKDKAGLIEEYKRAIENPGVDSPSLEIRAFLHEMWV